MASNFSLRREQKVPRIVDLHVHFRIADDVEVVLGEIGGDDARHQRLDLGDRLVLDGGSIETAPAVTPAPQPITSTVFAFAGTSVVRWPSMRCSRMSCGSLDACTLPAL